MTFIDLIVKWHGKKCGARKALARALGVGAASVSHWTSGRYKPNDDIINAIAGLLGSTEQEIRAVLPTPLPSARISNSTRKAIASLASLVMHHPAGSNPEIKNAMETIIDLCQGERS